jgi:hypothetical protein
MARKSYKEKLPNGQGKDLEPKNHWENKAKKKNPFVERDENRRLSGSNLPLQRHPRGSLFSRSTRPWVPIRSYLFSRRHVVSVASKGGAKIVFFTKRIGRGSVIEFIDKIEKAQNERVMQTQGFLTKQ